MKTFFMSMTAVTALFMTTILHAAQSMPEPKVEYSADMQLDSGGAVMAGKVYHGSGGKERQEFDTMGGHVVITSAGQECHMDPDAEGEDVHGERLRSGTG